MLISFLKKGLKRCYEAEMPRNEAAYEDS